MAEEKGKQEAEAAAVRKRKPLALRVLGIAGIALGSIVALLVLAFAGLMIWLTPERCTSLFNRYVHEFVDADVHARRVGFTFFSTFPRFCVEAEGLEVVSHSLRKLPPEVRDSLPSWSDSLLNVKSFRGGMNPLRLLTGVISVSNVDVDGLRANIVAANDTLGNYSIFPPSEEKESSPFKMPRFKADRVRFTDTAPLRYFSLPTKACAEVGLSRAELLADKGKSGRYRLDIGGNVSFEADGMRVFSGFPFGFSGNVDLKFDPFRISLDRYSIALGNVRSHIDVSLEMSGDPGISRLQYDIAPASVLTLLGYLPRGMMPGFLDGMKSDIALEARIRMTAPWKFSSTSLPSFAIDFRVPDSYLEYHLAGVGSYRISDLGMSGSFFFNGNDPRRSILRVDRLTLAGEGLSLQAGARIASLTDDPDFDVDAAGHADLTRIMRFLPGMESLAVDGKLDFDARMKFLLSAISRGELAEVKVDGSASLNDFIYRDLKLKSEVSGRKLRIRFGSDVRDMGGKRYEQGMLALGVDADTIGYSEPGLSAGISGVRLTGGSTRDFLKAGSLSRGQILPFGISLKAASASFRSEPDSMTVTARGLASSGALRRFEGNGRSPLVDLSLALGAVAMREPTMIFDGNGLSSSLRLHLDKQQPRKRVSRYQMRFDSIAAAHPEISLDSVAKLAEKGRKSRKADNTLVSLDLDRGVKRLIRKWNLSGHLKAAGGMFSSWHYPARNYFRDLLLDFSLDSVSLHSLRLRSQSNTLALRGKITNLRQFMLGSRKTPVKVRLAADIDTVDINSIAATYERGMALGEKLRREGAIPPEALASDTHAASGNDTVTILVPRNIDAEVKVSANHCFYTNLDLYGLGTDLYVRNSVFEVDSLRADSDFGKAAMNLAYSTRDINDINMSLDIAFDKIDIVKFFQKFRAVEEMMPEMTNLRGFVSAKAAASFDVFPNMDIDIPSLRAVIDLRGNDLWLHQSHFIRSITKRLLIRDNKDLRINNMVVQASVHDNLLELYPFIFEMNRYKLGFMGENDFNGNLYYHVSVLKSPIPFKFGINVKGTFDKYKIRFGGAKFKSDQAYDMISLVEHKRVNLVKEMRRYLNEFVHKAALSDTGHPGNRMLSSPEMKADYDRSMPGTSPIKLIIDKDSVLTKALQKAVDPKGKKYRK